MEKTRPYIKCRRVEIPRLDDWAAIGEVFKGADFAHFQQGWREEPEDILRPAKAAATWDGESILVYGELCDDDIFNSVMEEDFNKLSIDFGDVFEMFFKPSGQDSYFEFHVNPNNQKFQLRLPCKNAFKLMKDKFTSEAEMLESFKMRERVLESAVKLERGKWRVAAKLPLSCMSETGPVKAGAKWGFSFCRYDYTRPAKEPVYSSSSPHSAISYHLIDEYGTLEFV